jgi:hypothetical protein
VNITLKGVQIVTETAIAITVLPIMLPVYAVGGAIGGIKYLWKKSRRRL